MWNKSLLLDHFHIIKFLNILILDKNDSDSMASKRDAVSKAERAFKLFDKDNDGFITIEEFQQISKKQLRAISFVVTIQP